MGIGNNDGGVDTQRIASIYTAYLKVSVGERDVLEKWEDQCDLTILIRRPDEQKGGQREQHG